MKYNQLRRGDVVLSNLGTYVRLQDSLWDFDRTNDSDIQEIPENKYQVIGVISDQDFLGELEQRANKAHKENKLK